MAATGKVRHTSGPWIYDIHEHSFYIFTKSELEMVADGDPDDVGISRVRGVGRGADAAEQEANARLIAAAPDLLEACKLLEAADHQWANCPECAEAASFPELCERCFPLLDEARLKRRAAILKAEGVE